MPTIDVSDVTMDPDFAERLTIIRREEVINAKGRTTLVPTTISPAPYGTVLPQDDQPLQRGPDQQNLPRLLEVHTPFRLRSASKDPVTGKKYQPDIVQWEGDNFIVNRVYPFSHFGAGFIRAVCSSTDTLDNGVA